MGKKYLVRLTDEQRAALEERFAEPLTLRQRNRIQVLLRSAAGETDADIADELGISSNTVTNARKRFAAEGLEPALTEKPRTGGPAVLGGKGEAVLIGLAGPAAAEGRERRRTVAHHARAEDRTRGPRPGSHAGGVRRDRRERGRAAG